MGPQPVMATHGEVIDARWNALRSRHEKVVQAAGRLVRRAEDRGVVVLVGRRFRWREHAELLPDDWNPSLPDDPIAAVTHFWKEQP